MVQSALQVYFRYFVYDVSYLAAALSFLLLQGALFLMLGTADELALEPEKKTVFMEDLSEAELNTKVDSLTMFPSQHIYIHLYTVCK